MGENMPPQIVLELPAGTDDFQPHRKTAYADKRCHDENNGDIDTDAFSEPTVFQIINRKFDDPRLNHGQAGCDHQENHSRQKPSPVGLPERPDCAEKLPRTHLFRDFKVLTRHIDRLI